MTDYIVFARKYRPQTLNDLMGQDILAAALSKAIAQNQLSHAILLHGIRGVGKTTTARIIAKGLNCEKGPTVEPCGICASCDAIQKERHLDVIEMDAASHTSVDDIREIIETAKYKAVQGRFKVYIIDEVHMLSKSAFNALLKTLEEPPPFVKFIFATTEIQKVPETILSRCMRFDLKRMDLGTIISRLNMICGKEGVSLEEEAAALIARAADGSMRDALSLLDQACALSKDKGITTETTRNMLGMSSRESLFDLLEVVFSGQTEGIFHKTDAMFNDGADPLLLCKDLLDGLYWLIAFKTKPQLKNDTTLPASERALTQELADKIDRFAMLQVWQVLSKQYELVFKSPSPAQSLQVVLLQLAHLAKLPPMGELIAQGDPYTGKPTISSAASSTPSLASVSSSSPASEKIHSTTVDIQENKGSEGADEKPVLPTFNDLIAFLKEKREVVLYTHFLSDISVESYAPGQISFYTKASAPKNLSVQLKAFLQKHTSTQWDVKDLGMDAGALSLQDRQREEVKKRQEESLHHPSVKELMEAFPGATVEFTEEAA